MFTPTKTRSKQNSVSDFAELTAKYERIRREHGSSRSLHSPAPSTQKKSRVLKIDRNDKPRAEPAFATPKAAHTPLTPHTPARTPSSISTTKLGHQAKVCDGCFNRRLMKMRKVGDRQRA